MNRPLAAAALLLATTAVIVGGLALGGGAHADRLFHTGPVPSKTGAPDVGDAPGEPNCTFCHQTFGGTGAIPNLNLPGGTFRILDLPPAYRPGNTYSLRVQLDSDSTRSDLARRWGFQLTAVLATDGTGAGTFSVPSTDTLQIVTGDPSEPWPTRSYVEHTADGIHQSENGPVEWHFFWKAPDVPSGTVYFFAAGNAANGSLDPSGDFIYSTADTMTDTTTAVARTTWGQLKARYR